MKDPIALIDAILDVYDRQDFQPLANGETFCNLAVIAVCLAFGCPDLSGKTADEIVLFLSSSPDWSLIPFEKAQDMANQGSLLIAGLDSVSLRQSHGHVVILRPGKPVYSGKWGPCPRVLNIGAENFVSRAKKGPLTNQPCGLNESFVEIPKIYGWRNSL